MYEYQIKTSQLIVSKTDVEGFILTANDVFCEISGFEKSELIGQDHNIVRHPDMPRAVFKLLWVKLFDGQEVHAFVKNIRKDGGYYWVYATVTPQFDRTGDIESFMSVRKKANPKAIKAVEMLYKELKSLEKPSGYGQSVLKLKEVLDSAGKKYNDFIISLQKS